MREYAEVSEESHNTGAQGAGKRVGGRGRASLGACAWRVRVDSGGECVRVGRSGPGGCQRVLRRRAVGRGPRVWARHRGRARACAGEWDAHLVVLSRGERVTRDCTRAGESETRSERERERERTRHARPHRERACLWSTHTTLARPVQAEHTQNSTSHIHASQTRASSERASSVASRDVVVRAAYTTAANEHSESMLSSRQR